MDMENPGKSFNSFFFQKSEKTMKNFQIRILETENKRKLKKLNAYNRSQIKICKS